EDRFQELGLPLERRPRSRIEKRQLGSQQADALGSLLESLDRLSHGRRVYQDGNAVTVGGHRGLVAPAARFLARPLPTDSLFMRGIDTGRIRAAGAECPSTTRASTRATKPGSRAIRTPVSTISASSFHPRFCSSRAMCSRDLISASSEARARSRCSARSDGAIKSSLSNLPR